MLRCWDSQSLPTSSHNLSAQLGSATRVRLGRGSGTASSFRSLSRTYTVSSPAFACNSINRFGAFTSSKYSAASWLTTCSTHAQWYAGAYYAAALTAARGSQRKPCRSSARSVVQW